MCEGEAHLGGGPQLALPGRPGAATHPQTTESRAQDTWLCRLLLMAHLRPPKLVFGKEVCRDRQHLARQALT